MYLCSFTCSHVLLFVLYYVMEVDTMATHYEQRKEANERYLSKMDEIRIRMPKESGLKNAIQAHAEACGESVQAFILRAIQQTMEQDRKGAD